MAIHKSDTELRNHLKDQIDFLQRSAKAFDDGYINEAIRMATTIRVLVHDGQFISLLSSLKKNNMKFYDTSAKKSGKQIQPTGFLRLKIKIVNGKSEGGYSAPLDDRPPSIDVNKKITFLSWWNQKIIEDKKGNKFSRKNLVLDVSNKDGGAHVDPNLSDKYAALTRYNSLGWKVSDSKGENRDMEGIELVCIRQICHEILKSLKDEFPELFTDDVSNSKSMRKTTV